MKSTSYVTSVPEFIAGLPKDLVCASTVYTQHAYIGGDDPVEQADAALAARGCPQPHTIWITETGVGPAPKDLSAGASIPAPPRAAARCTTSSSAGSNDPRVTVAFQYTVREDDKFPDRPGQHRPDHRPPRAEGMDRLGRRPQPADPPPPPAEPKADRPLGYTLRGVGAP